MKDFFKEMLIETFKDREYFLGILMWILTIIIVGFLGFLLVWFIDSAHLPINKKQGVLTNKYIRPAHYTTTYIKSGQVMIPIETFHDTSYNLEITINDLTNDIAVYENYYNSVSVGSKIKCEYTKGRIMNTIYIKNVK